MAAAVRALPETVERGSSAPDRDWFAKLSPLLKSVAYAPRSMRRMASAGLAEGSLRRHVPRRPVVLRAIWREEMVQSDEQGMFVPVIAARLDTDRQCADIAPGVAIVPMCRRVTTCSFPPDEGVSPTIPLPIEER